MYINVINYRFIYLDLRYIYNFPCTGRSIELKNEEKYMGSVNLLLYVPLNNVQTR